MAPEMRKALLCAGAALLLACAGLAQVHGGVAAPSGDAEPLLRRSVGFVFARVSEGYTNLAANPHGAFPGMADLLVLLGSTAFLLPTLSRLGFQSSVLASLMLGIAIGPSGLALFRQNGWADALANVGVLFFLCQMGLELSLQRLRNLRRDVFVVGLAQLALSTAVIHGVMRRIVGCTHVQSLVIGAALSMSSSAIVLQILDEQKERGTRHGRAAFGILLLQDLAVPLLLLLLPTLPGATGPQALTAMWQGALCGLLALAACFAAGRWVLGRLFGFVANSGSPAALRCLSFFVIFGAVFAFQSLGLPGTVGAFLAGVLLSETAYRQTVDAAISPVREDFFCVFFIAVGCAIDLRLVVAHPTLILSVVSALLLAKSVVTMAVCKAAGLSFANAQQIGLLLSQAGEFSFVVVNSAWTIGLIDELSYKLLVTVVGVSLVSTPLFAAVGRGVTEYMEQFKAKKDPERTRTIVHQDESVEVVICGYGRIGKMISQVLDKRLVRWIAFDVNPAVVGQARKRDLPVFYGDMKQMVQADGRSQSMLSMAKMVVITLSERKNIAMRNSIALGLKSRYPQMLVLARALGMDDAKALAQDGINVIMPTVPEDSMLLNLPLGAATLERLGYSEEDIAPVLRDKRLALIREEEEQRRDLLAKIGQIGGLSADLDTIASWYDRRQRPPPADDRPQAAA